MPMSDYGFEYTGEDFTEEQRKIVFVETTKIIEKGEPVKLLSGAYYDRGIIHADQDNYDKAIEDYTNAIRLNFYFLEAAYYNRGLAYFKKMQYETALNDFNTALNLKPDDQDTKEMIKYILEMIKRTRKKINYLV